MSTVSKEKLEEDLQEVEAEIARLQEGLEDKPDYSLGEGDPAIYEWEMKLGRLQDLKERAETIKNTMQKIDKGVYGVCERCGGEISSGRLEALPEATLCIECARSGRQGI